MARKNMLLQSRLRTVGFAGEKCLAVSAIGIQRRRPLFQRGLKNNTEALLTFYKGAADSYCERLV
jgi:hypothetical protein